MASPTGKISHQHLESAVHTESSGANGAAVELEE